MDDIFIYVAISIAAVLRSWYAWYRKSIMEHLLIGPAARDLFKTHTNNVLNPLKAGGLFVNGKVASMFGEVAAFLLFAASRYGSAVAGSASV
ncbi:hypothetical protein [Arthrobacter sp. zg-Y769]|uniref:hypothetical protein n=1 Tax=Arthrobacter sp. zg-Y769 TaxID=2894191 RepID=UPI001E606F6C|nr:hypothetical protein [Arthrobacter sp. zg-Y769]MCC9205438.1 hypothetical protein [Arthrobacter sp. zg-Y769]